MSVIVVRGTGDVGSAVAHRLFGAGHAVVLHDRPRPPHPRRGMAFADALFDGRAELDGVMAKLAADADSVRRMLRCRGAIPVSDAPLEGLLEAVRPDILIDARMRKHAAAEAQKGLAPLVIGLGPGHCAGETTHVAIETAYGPNLGAIVERGPTAALAGEPKPLGGHGRERFVYAPRPGTMQTSLAIGDRVESGTVVGRIGDVELRAPLSGWLRGLAHDGAEVDAGSKVIEIQTSEDAPLRGLGERPRRIADGVLAAVSSARVPRAGGLAPFGERPRSPRSAT